MREFSRVVSISGRPVSPDWLVIGAHTYFSEGFAVGSWLAGEKIVIGKFCSIGRDVAILTGGNRRTDLAALYPIAVLAPSGASTGKNGRAPVGMTEATALALAQAATVMQIFIPGRTYQTTRHTTIGNDVWIGYGAVVKGGAHVGDGAIVASGAVVSSDVPPFAIVAGNPARVLRYRFSRETVRGLLRIAWWQWNDDRIRAESDWFYRPIAEFIARFDQAED